MKIGLRAAGLFCMVCLCVVLSGCGGGSNTVEIPSNPAPPPGAGPAGVGAGDDAGGAQTADPPPAVQP